MKAACVDHLVVMASDLPSGVRWCEQHLGVAPAAGGEHPLMGTHNRLLNISSAGHPRAYLEIIAIHAGAPKAIPEKSKRWFDLDDARLQRQIAGHGPQLIAWAASVPDITAADAVLQRLGLDCGAVTNASRLLEAGVLTWQITVRSDGRRQMQGCLPTLIQWGGAHPCDRLPARGVQLAALELEHPQANVLQEACAAIGMGSIPVRSEATPRLKARLTTPHGALELHSLPPAA